ncbi:MAG: hybrid sensor histidine kinase/response regulator [Holophagaceae bacterium]|nr:hybrid sensor histidine kinase/response regulator [Holophagaceae bacterium]
MSPKQKILCIEDNPVNWRLVQRLLGQAGYELHWAEEGLQGYQMAVELKPALVLLDINLPGLSGFEVATKLRQNADLNGIPIIALTAKTMKIDRETALVSGCDGYISKPIDPFQFTAQVEAYLGGQRDKVEQGREGAVLRQFSQQIVEHLEARLKEAQGSNRKLQEAQEALEIRNRNLSRLLALSQSIVAEPDPRSLLTRILGRAQEDLGLRTLHAFRVQADGGYFEGQRWIESGSEITASVRGDHVLPVRLKGVMNEGPIFGDHLLQSPFWEPGLVLGLWTQPSQSLLLPMPHRQSEGELWGFWALSREADRPYLPFEVELVSLIGGLAQVSLQNAELIFSLGESSRALASSYEIVESAYMEVHQAQAALSLRERQALLGDLFQKMTKRLQTPVATLQVQSSALDQMEQGSGEWKHSVAQIKDSVGQIASLVKALTRRVGKQESVRPEWIHLDDLLAQELELMSIEGHLGDRDLRLEIGAAEAKVFGIYGDFSETVSQMVRHALGGPTPSPLLLVRTAVVDGKYLLEMEDEGGPIPPENLDRAFEPFSGLREEPQEDLVLGVRKPGAGLPACVQLMSSYQAALELRNKGEGTYLNLLLQLDPEAV